MKTYHLRSNTEQEMLDALEAAELPENSTVVIIGTIYEPTGEDDDEGNPVMQALGGYHVNILADLTEGQEGLLPIIDKPKKPYGVFAS